MTKASQVGCWDRHIHCWSRSEDSGALPCHFALPFRSDCHTKRSHRGEEAFYHQVPSQEEEEEEESNAETLNHIDPNSLTQRKPKP